MSNTTKTKDNSGQFVKIILVLIPAIAASLAAWWQFGKANDTTSQTTFEGRVKDVQSEENIRNAKITLEVNGVPPVLYTDSEGVFSFPLKNNTQNIRIRVEAYGYKNFDRRILPTSKNEIEEIKLEKIPPPTPSPAHVSEGESEILPTPQEKRNADNGSKDQYTKGMTPTKASERDQSSVPVQTPPVSEPKPVQTPTIFEPKPVQTPTISEPKPPTSTNPIVQSVIDIAIIGKTSSGRMQGEIIGRNYGVYQCEKKVVSSLGTYLQNWRSQHYVLALMTMHDSKSAALDALDVLKSNFVNEGKWIITGQGDTVLVSPSSGFPLSPIHLSVENNTKPDYFMRKAAMGNVNSNNGGFWVVVRISVSN